MDEQKVNPIEETGCAANATAAIAVGEIDYARPTTATPSGESFGRRSARGAMMMASMTGAWSIVSFFTSIALAHFLLPADYGVVAVALSISGVVAVLRDAGASAILIQRHDEFDEIAGSVFWLNGVSAILCALLVIIAAPIVAHYKGEPILIPIMMLTALRFPFGAIGTVSNARLTIDLRWGAIAASSFVHPIVTAIVAITMAWRGFGVYSLIVPAIFADGIRGLVTWSCARVRAPLTPQWSIISRIIGSSVFIVLTNLTLAVRGFGDYLTLSFMTHDDQRTGLYLFAFTMCQAVSRLTVGALPLVLAPVFSKVRQEEARHAEIMTSSMHMSAALGALPLVMQAALAWPLFRLALAEKWWAAAPLFSIISLSALASFLNGLIFQAMWAHGKYREFFYYSIVFTPAMVLMFIVGAHFGGATGVAWANVVAAATDFALFPLFAFRLLKVPWKPVVAPLWRPLVAAIPTALAAWVVFSMLPLTRTGDVSRVLIVGTFGTAAYLGILMLIWRPVMMAGFGHVFGALGLARK